MSPIMGDGFFITFEGGEGTGKSTQLARLAARLERAGRAVTCTREPGGTEAAEAIRALLVTGETDSLSATSEALLNYAARDDHLRRVIRPALARGEVVLCDRFMDSTRAYQGLAGDCPLSLVDALERDVVGETRPALTFVLDLDIKTGLRRVGARAYNNKFDDTKHINIIINIEYIIESVLEDLNDDEIDAIELYKKVRTSVMKNKSNTNIVMYNEYLRTFRDFIRVVNENHRFESRGILFHENVRKAFLEIARENPDRCVVIDASGTPDEVEEAIWRVVSGRLGLDAGQGG